MDTTELRSRATQPWAASMLAALRRRVGDALARGATIPSTDQISGWSHNFTCSRCARPLPFHWDMPGPFTCDACGNVDDDQDRREAWTYKVNLKQIQLAVEACVLAQIEDAPAAIAYACDVLLGYTRRYLKWPLHGRWAGSQGRLQSQGLSEAVWMLHASEVFDRLGWLGALSDAERREVCDNLFAPAIVLLHPQANRVHNIQVWMASALLAMGERCSDSEIAGFARQHLFRNLERGVLADGSWFECSTHYHYYACKAVMAGAEACRRFGSDVPGFDVLRRMVRSPLSLLKPDGHLALLNDGGAENPITSHAAFYEHADALVGGCADVLAAIYRRGAARHSLEALLYGPEHLPEGDLALPALATCDGIITVRRGGLLALVKANPHGGDHDHFDEPALDLHLLDASLDAGDLGNPGYGHPLHQGWFKRTAAHNTVLIDSADHAPCRPHLLEAEDRGPISVVRVRDTGAIPNGSIHRTVVVGDGWVVDRTAVDLAEAHEVLWRFHARAAFACAADTRPGTFLANPHVTEQRELLAGESLDGMWTSASGGRLAVRVWRPTGAEPRFGAASAPALPATEHVELVCAAARGPRTVFTACFAIGALPDITCTAVAGGTRFAITGTSFVITNEGMISTSDNATAC